MPTQFGPVHLLGRGAYCAEADHDVISICLLFGRCLRDGMPLRQSGAANAKRKEPDNERPRDRRDEGVDPHPACINAEKERPLQSRSLCDLLLNAKSAVCAAAWLVSVE